MTRLLDRHLVVFNCGSRRADLALRHRQGLELRPLVQPGWPHNLKIAYSQDDVTLSGLVPWHLYLLRVESRK